MKSREIRKRLAGLGLALVLTVTGVMPAAADELPGSAISEENSIDLQNEDTAEDLSDENSGESLPEISETEPVVEENAVQEEIEEEVQEEVVTDEAFTATEIAPLSIEESAEPKLVYADQAGNETVITIQAENVKKAEAGEHYTVAVWSKENNQDDLRWYDMSFNAEKNCYQANVNIKDHKTIGLYYTDLYFAESGKPMQFVVRDTFDIKGVEAEKLEVSDINKDKGTATVTISGVRTPSGVTRVQFPTWCKADQSDLVWYEGTKVSEGVYRITLDVSKHSYHYGTYQIHTYGTSQIGARNFMLKTTCVMEQGEVSVEAVEGNDGYTLRASNLNLSDAADAEFAVWSTANGQDDLKWLVMKPTATGSVSTKWAPQEYGEYIIHCYVKTKNGTMVFQKGIKVDIKGPKVSAMDISADQKTGKFTIRLSGVEGVQQIKHIQIPVWSDPKQADIIWYEAARQSDGTYVVNGDIAKHNYNLGTYNAHVYIRDEKEKPYFQLKDTFKMEAGCTAVKAEDISDPSKPFSAYRATAENVVIPGGISKVEFAVWSVNNGQDDLKWYNATANAGTYTYTIDPANHKTAGKYLVHCYAETKTGKKVFLGAAEFTVDLSAEGSIRLIEKDEKAGTFKIGITLTESSSSITGLKVPVWVKSDKSDLHEYTAEASSDGEWLVTVNAANHKYDFGTYSIQANVVFANGFNLTAAETTVSFAPSAFLSVTKPADGRRTVTLSNVASTVKKVTFPTWSITGGQDDLTWYTAKKQADGTWTADILAENLKHEGDVITHCYVDDVFTGSVSSSFTKAELEIRIGTQKVHKYAQALIAANGGDLYRIYKWIVNSYTYVSKPIPVPYPNGYTRQEFYFTDAYETHLTNCFGFAATFYWVAKEMGYDVTLKEASVRYRSGSYGPHGWVEVRRNGTTYICDPELEYEKGVNSYMVTYASSPFSYAPNTPAY